MAAEILGIPGVMTFPKDFLQRTITVKALTQTESAVRATFEKQVEELSEYILANPQELEVNKPKQTPKRRGVEDESPSP